MKFELLVNGKLEREPAGVMVVVDNETAAQYTLRFPEWLMLSATKFTKGKQDTYAELMAEYERWVFWHPSSYIKDPLSRRSVVMRNLCSQYPERVEVYGYSGKDTVQDVMDYTSVLFPSVVMPTHKMSQYAAYEWRYSKRKRMNQQVQVLKWTNSTDNMDLIKSAINN